MSKMGRPVLSIPCTKVGCPGHSVHTMTTCTRLDGVVVRRCECSEGHRFTSYNGGPAALRAKSPLAPPPNTIKTEWRPYPFGDVIDKSPARASMIGWPWAARGCNRGAA